MTGKSVFEILLDALIEQRREVGKLQLKVKALTADQSELDREYERFNAIVVTLLNFDLSRVSIRRDLKKGHEGLLIVKVIDSSVSFRFPAKFLVGDIQKKVEKKMNSKIKLVEIPVDFKGTTKPMVEEEIRGIPHLFTMHDAKVRWTSQLRMEALKQLKAEQPSLHERYRLANLKSFRDAQFYCTAVTKQSYCEVRGGYGSEVIVALFGGNVGGDYSNETPIPHIQGGSVQWYRHQMRAGWTSTGHETICQIVKPSDWLGNEAEMQNWRNFVDANLDRVIAQIKSADDPQKQYFDVRQIPDMSHWKSVLGYSELRYD